MNYQAHQIGGACASLVVATTMYHASLDQPTTYIAIGLTVFGGIVGGLLPDIDHPTSRIGRRMPLTSQMINGLFGHRGFTHTLVAAMLFMYSLFLLSTAFPDGFQGFFLPLSLGLSVGYLSHLLLDMLTVSGIPLLYPIFRKDIRIAKLKSGRDDLLVILLTIGLTGIYLYFFGVM